MECVNIAYVCDIWDPISRDVRFVVFFSKNSSCTDATWRFKVIQGFMTEIHWVKNLIEFCDVVADDIFFLRACPEQHRKMRHVEISSFITVRQKEDGSKPLFITQPLIGDDIGNDDSCFLYSVFRCSTAFSFFLY